MKRVDSDGVNCGHCVGRAGLGQAVRGDWRGPAGQLRCPGEPRIPGRALGRSRSHSLDLCVIGASLSLHLAPFFLSNVAMSHVPDQL